MSEVGDLPRGERVYLRALARADVPRIAAFLAAPAVRTAVHLEGTVTPADEEAFAIALATAPGQVVLGIAAVDDGRLLGLCGLHRTSAARHEAELGIFVGDPADWGKGFGTEATALLVAHGFERLGLDRISLRVLAGHDRAIRAYERAGFRRDACASAPAGGDAPAELASMSLTRAGWLAARPRRGPHDERSS